MVKAINILRSQAVNHMLDEMDLEMTPIDENHVEAYDAELERRKKLVRSKNQSPDLEMTFLLGCDSAGFQAWKVAEFGLGATYLFRYFDSHDDPVGEYHIGKAVYRGES